MICHGADKYIQQVMGDGEIPHCLLLTQIGHWRLNIFCFIVEQIGCLCNVGVAGYVKLQRQARCRQENKIC